MSKSGMFEGCGTADVDRCSPYYMSRYQTEHSVQSCLLLIVKMNDSRVELNPVGLNLYLLGERCIYVRRDNLVQFNTLSHFFTV